LSVSWHSMTLWPFQSVVCFSAPYVRHFVAPRLSPAYLLHLFGLLGVILIPLYATFGSGNVWVKESSYREQPRVTFANDLLFVLSGRTTAEAVGWSTRQELRALLPSEIVVPAVRASALDVNHDSVPDELRLTLEIPLATVTSGFQRLLLLAAYRYELHEKVAEHIGGLVTVDVSTPYLATGVWLRGRARLRQHLPFQEQQTPRTIYAQSPLEIDLKSSWAAKNYPISLRALLDRYAARNETMYLEQTALPVWDYSPRDYFSVELVLDAQPELVQYRPGAAQLLKFAWMQVLAFFFPVYLVVRAFQSFAYSNQIVETYVVPQVPLKGNL